MVKSWDINALVERDIGGKWFRARIVGISPANRTLRLLYDHDNHLEDGVDFDDVRVIEADKSKCSPESAKLNGNRCAVESDCMKKGDVVERDIDGVRVFWQNSLYDSL